MAFISGRGYQGVMHAGHPSTLPSFYSSMYRLDLPSIISVAVLALVGYALYAHSARLRRLETPPTRPRRTRQNAPPRSPAGLAVQPRRKVSVARASASLDPDIEIISYVACSSFATGCTYFISGLAHRH